MVKGARQVGKTYLIREFGKKEYKSFVEINFIKNQELKQIFAGTLDAESVYKRMTAMINGVNLVKGDTLIFLDEIQACGSARTALKFLAEDGRFDVITSGSLLGLTYGEDADENTEEPESVPTGYETFLTMYSLDFEEFLWAEGYESGISYLKELFEKEKIPAPKSTLIFQSNHHSFEQISEQVGAPFILKIPDGSYSIGMKKVSNEEELQASLKILFEKSAILLAQAFTPTEFDWRVGLLNGVPLYACKYYMAKGHWQIYCHYDSGRSRCGLVDTIPIYQVPRVVLELLRLPI